MHRVLTFRDSDPISVMAVDAACQIGQFDPDEWDFPPKPRGNGRGSGDS
jgi:hypothetical protein